jgi:1-deoxy-D-xylulose 5-phosphate reductoisomerase
MFLKQKIRWVDHKKCLYNAVHTLMRLRGRQKMNECTEIRLEAPKRIEHVYETTI